MIGIRCDANSIIASGHMMRCLTIAKEIVRQGHAVTFFVADKESEEALGSMTSEFKAVVLGSSYREMEAELPALAKELSARGVGLLLVDSYSVTVSYFERLKKLCPVAYIDDLHEADYPVDLLINYSGYYKELGYEKAYEGLSGFLGMPTKLMLGLEYAPLREQFYQIGESQQGDDAEHKPSVLLASGGADAFGMLLGTLEAAKEQGIADIIWHVVVGSFCKDGDAIEAFAAAHPNVFIHRDVSDMAGLMRQCDLAVCAAGTMLTECAALRLPAVFYQVADNQRYNVDFFGNTGGMIFAGDVTGGCRGDFGSDNTSAGAVQRGICHIITAILEEDRLSDMRAALKGYTDGRGAVRIAGELIETERKQA